MKVFRQETTTTSGIRPPNSLFVVQIGYEGMGRRGIRRGTITTSRFTALCQGSKKVAYIEVDGSDGTDLAIMECTAEAFERKFGYNEINGFQWESGW